MSLEKPNTVADFVSVGVTATHQFKISYSKTKILPAGRSICSPTFSVAGYNCNILYYPQGLVSDPNSVCLILVLGCKSAVTVSFAYSFLDKNSRPSSKASDRTTFKFSPKCTKFGIKDIIKRSDLEDEFVKDDYFTLVFSLTITSDSPCKEVPKQFVNGIFPSSINEHFTKLLENKEMADVTFDVNGEIFTAHRLVLSACSPVFKAEFFGRMSESKLKSIQIKNIMPEIFKAMLHFIYSDSLPHMSDKDVPIVTQVQQLYKAADTYAMDGLKAVCEEELMRNVSVDTVISSLALAEEHNCTELKDVCFDFACMPENLIQLALKAEYVELMHSHPFLLKNFGEHARDHAYFSSLVLKTKRIN